MQKTYQPQTIEAKWTQFWEENGYFQPTASSSSYSIALPPPNVTGTLHMGHGFQHSIMDALIRRARMQGKDTLWQPGTDHAGIATQMVVERRLAEQGQSRHDMGRDAFIDQVWQWREQSGATITQQMRRLGTSPDWSREHFSMGDQVTRATYAAFIDLFEQGLIYRGKRLVNWDPQLHTAISDLEVENRTKQGHLWHIRYPLTDGSAQLTVATTRPETLFGDMAVAVHPDDERYKKLIGKTIHHPLTGRDIPIIPDDYVDKDFGTGCVKITPAHDFNDYEMGKRHDLPMLNIMTIDACLNDNVPEKYRGLERFAARKQVIQDLEAQGLLEKIEEHQTNIPYGDRSGVVIEPLLTDQWYIKVDALAQPAIEAVKSGKVKFIPDNWSKTYLQWMDNIQDWCISRQLWWGHRIPVWYDENQKAYTGFDEADVRQRHQLAEDITLRQDDDVLDTWFTASLWPFSSLGWPEKTDALKQYYPTNVLVTGFDIIFFWVARMIMMGLHFMQDVPFREVYITGLIRDSHGQKMSKSKGNILDPIDLIDGVDLDTLIDKRCRGLMQPQMKQKVEKATRKEFPHGIEAFGTDALRFTFCSLATTGRDINFDMSRIESYRNFCNKLWNAARYVLMNTESHDCRGEKQFSAADHWIQSKLQHTIHEVNRHFEQYRLDLITQVLYEFTWNEYCDWYLELSKAVLNNPNASQAELNGTRYTLLSVLETLLRLMHPLMPFVTEEIWQRIAPLIDCQADTIMLQTYPEYNPQSVDTQAEEEIDWLKQFITAIRNIRSEVGVKPSQKINVLLCNGDALIQQRVERCMPYIQLLARIDQAEWPTETLPATAKALVGNLEIHIPLAGLIDKEAEINRLNKEIEKLQKDQERSQKKLSNESYVAKAPAEVVDKERAKLTDMQFKLEQLNAHKQTIENL